MGFLPPNCANWKRSSNTLRLCYLKV
jgi:hypothetical protein